MTIKEMHIMFRQYAQQMGMQNVRAILPEQIDLLINNSISDTINQIVTQNVGATNDRVITDNSKLNQVNALRSLYSVYSYNLGSDQSRKSGNIEYRSDDLSNLLGGNKYLFIVDAAISYKKTNSNNTTSIFPVRIIDDMYLADVINDFVLAPRFRSPVMTVHDNKFEIYIDDSDKLNGLNLSIDKLRVSYIAKPNVVAYFADVGGTNVDCNLPDYMHGDIVKHAVELYQVALSGSLAATQQAERNQQRENLRNNYRNEGDTSNNNINQ